MSRWGLCRLTHWTTGSLGHPGAPAPPAPATPLPLRPSSWAVGDSLRTRRPAGLSVQPGPPPNPSSGLTPRPPQPSLSGPTACPARPLLQAPTLPADGPARCRVRAGVEDILAAQVEAGSTHRYRLVDKEAGAAPCWLKAWRSPCSPDLPPTSARAQAGLRKEQSPNQGKQWSGKSKQDFVIPYT